MTLTIWGDIDKLLDEHDWLLQDDYFSNQPIVIKNEHTFNQCMESATLHILEEEQHKETIRYGNKLFTSYFWQAYIYNGHLSTRYIFSSYHIEPV